MKKIYTKLSIVALMFAGVTAQAQVKVQSDVSTSIYKENPFLDASIYTQSPNNQGKGLYFPQTDLTTWEFKTSNITPGNFNTYFDGMIVYNTATGNTVDDPAKGGVKVEVKPGFYYFSNPNQSFPTGNINSGRWIPLGGTAATAGNTGADYKVNMEIPTGEYFWIDGSTKKVVYRKMIEVNFPDKTFTNVTGKVNDKAQFIRAQIVDKATGRVIVNSAEFKPNSNAEFGGATGDDYFVAKFGGMSTTLSGDYRMILEYYLPNP